MSECTVLTFSGDMSSNSVLLPVVTCLDVQYLLSVVTCPVIQYYQGSHPPQRREERPVCQNPVGLRLIYSVGGSDLVWVRAGESTNITHQNTRLH